VEFYGETKKTRKNTRKLIDERESLGYEAGMAAT